MPAHRPLTRQDYRTLLLAALGGALEFYDFIIFVFFATVIGELFFPPDIPDWLRLVQTFGIFAAGYLVRPLGGVVMAHFGDRLGRKKMFTLSLLLMALPTLGIGLLPVYQSAGLVAPLLLLAMRMLQGAAIGGEVPGAWVFVAEHVPSHRVGIACGMLTAGLTVGILLGSLMATALNYGLTTAQIHDGGWRLPFITGGVFGLAAIWLRRMLHETPVFMEMAQRRAAALTLPVRQVVRHHRPALVLSMCLTWLLSAGVVVVILMSPVWLQTQLGVPPVAALQANTLATLALCFGCLAAGLAADRFGASRTLIIGCLLMGGCCLLFYSQAGRWATHLNALYSLAGLSVGVVGAVPYVMVRAFPAEVRFSGIALAYNLAYALCGGFTPLLVTLLMAVSSLALGWYVLGLTVLGMGCGVWLAGQSRAPAI